jgi:hypothetical protein
VCACAYMCVCACLCVQTSKSTRGCHRLPQRRPISAAQVWAGCALLAVPCVPKEAQRMSNLCIHLTAFSLLRRLHAASLPPHRCRMRNTAHCAWQRPAVGAGVSPASAERRGRSRRRRAP